MVLHCPVCHSKYSVDDLIREGIRDDLIDLAAFFGNVWPLVNEYVDCFRAGQWGSVGEKKKVRLLTEIKMLFEKAEFECDGKRYRTDRAAILGALRAVCDTEKYGFKNHNYLKRVLLGSRGQGSGVGAKDFSPVQVRRPERVSAEGMTAKEEKERENKRMRRSEDKSPLPPFAKGGDEEITGAEYLKRHDISSLLDKVGKGIN
jgi:hypothetical protein